MKILVTGSNGFLGAALVERLIAHGEEDIRCFVRPGSNRSRLDDVMRRHPDAPLEMFEGSLATVPGAKAALDGVDLLYHLAAAPSGAPADIFLNTVVASQKLLEAMGQVDRPPKTVFVSSFGVYQVADLPRGGVLDESTPLETHPEKRDLYSAAKLRQEQLVWEYQDKVGFPLVVLRPGVIYGPGGSALSARVGIRFPGIFLYLGFRNLLPLTYVDNCAEAIVAAGNHEDAVGRAFNVVDDDLLTCREYLRMYECEVERLRKVPLPYGGLLALSRAIEWYHGYSKGQLPAVFTPYKVATMWKGNRFSNERLKSLGWQPIVPTPEGLRRTFAYLRSNL